MMVQEQIKDIFNTYFKGEVNLVTPKVYGYDAKVYKNNIILFEKSKDAYNEMYGVTTLIANCLTDEVQRIDLSRYFNSAKEAREYIKNIKEEDVNFAQKYGEKMIY